MMLKYLVGLCLLSVCYETVFGDSEIQFEINLFDRVDKDKNGVLTKDELKQVFEFFDVDNNGQVTKGEMEDIWENKLKYGPKEEAAKLFDRSDVNDNGYIDTSDLDGIFDYFDNKDPKNGRVTQDEVVKGWVDTLNFGSEEEAKGLFAKVDANDDSILNIKVEAEDLVPLFHKFDQDKNGKVDVSEFLEQWAKLKN